jgi:hypothetical protein
MDFLQSWVFMGIMAGLLVILIVVFFILRSRQNKEE